MLTGLLLFIVLLPPIAAVAVLNVPEWRRRVITEPVFRLLRGVLPEMSSTEREALEAGTTWWEKDLFSGAPDWEAFDRIALPTLAPAEQSFMDVEVEELCRLIDDWEAYWRRDGRKPVWVVGVQCGRRKKAVVDKKIVRAESERGARRTALWFTFRPSRKQVLYCRIAKASDILIAGCYCHVSEPRQ